MTLAKEKRYSLKLANELIYFARVFVVTKLDEKQFRAVVQSCSVKKGVLEKFTKFIGKHLCQSFFFNKVEAVSLQLYLKRDSGTGVFL